MIKHTFLCLFAAMVSSSNAAYSQSIGLFGETNETKTQKEVDIRNELSLYPKWQFDCERNPRVSLLYRGYANFNDTFLVRLGFLPISQVELNELIEIIDDERRLRKKEGFKPDNFGDYEELTDVQIARFKKITIKYPFLKDPVAFFDEDNIHLADPINADNASEYRDLFVRFGGALNAEKSSKVCSVYHRGSNEAIGDCNSAYQHQIFSAPRSKLSTKELIEMYLTKTIDLVLPAATSNSVFLREHIETDSCIGGTAQLNILDARLLQKVEGNE